MDDNHLESRLTELGANWPVESVVDSVSKRIQLQLGHPAASNHAKANRKVAWIAVGASACLTVLLCVWFGTIISRPAHALDGIEERFRQLNSLYVKGTTYETIEIDGKKTSKNSRLSSMQPDHHSISTPG